MRIPSNLNNKPYTLYLLGICSAMFADLTIEGGGIIGGGSSNLNISNGECRRVSVKQENLVTKYREKNVHMLLVLMTWFIDDEINEKTKVKSGQVWKHVPRRQFAALTFLLHSFGLFQAIARACAGPIFFPKMEKLPLSINCVISVGLSSMICNASRTLGCKLQLCSLF